MFDKTKTALGQLEAAIQEELFCFELHRAEIAVPYEDYYGGSRLERSFGTEAEVLSYLQLKHKGKRWITPDWKMIPVGDLKEEDITAAGRTAEYLSVICDFDDEELEILKADDQDFAAFHHEYGLSHYGYYRLVLRGGDEVFRRDLAQLKRRLGELETA